MALVVKDRVQETTTTTGTGTITLAGAVTGFQSFSVIGNANTTYYTIAGTSEWEVGLGTYTSSGTTLSRDTILESSNGGTAVNFSAGIKNVFCTYPAEKSLYLDASNNAIGLGTVATTTTLTNATGLPLTTGVTGTLPIANGGTGTTSTTFTNLTTNVTGTLPIANGGTGTTSTTFTNLTTNVTGTLPVANGGTGLITYTTGDILYASATNTLSKLAAGSNGQVLTLASGVPSWATTGAGTTLTNTTFTATSGQTSFSFVYDPALLQGVYRNGVKLDPSDYTSSSGTAIVLNTGAITGDNIQAQAFTGVSLGAVVTSIAFGSTGLTPSSPSTGNVTVGGTLAVANGGTGLATLTANNVILGNGTSAPTFVAPSTNGNVLTSNGTTWTSAVLPAGLPAGAIIQFAGTTAPTGYLLCPTSLTNISRTTYATLFAAIGTTWGVGNGTTTFGLPWFAVDYAAIQANANVGTASTGSVIAHTHTTVGGFSQYCSTGSADAQLGDTTSLNATSGSTGGSANLAAGARVLFCIKF